MMKYIKLILIYGAIMMAIQMIFSFANRDSWVNIIGVIFLNIVRVLAILHIGRTISNKLIRKKYYIYVSILYVEFATLYILSSILGVSLQNTWLSYVGINIVLVTQFIMIFDIRRTLNDTNGKIKALLSFGLFFTIIALVINNIIFLDS